MFFGRRKRPTDIVSWNIAAPRGFRWAYRDLARKLRVPLYVLALHVLSEWLRENYTDTSNEKWLTKFGDSLARRYLGDSEQR